MSKGIYDKDVKYTLGMTGTVANTAGRLATYLDRWELVSAVSILQ